MNTKQVITGAASVITAGALLVGGTIAYFNATDTSTENTLGTATLTIDLLNQNTEDSFSFAATNWLPGEEKLVNFDVKNTGSVDVFMRGFATGTWGSGNETLDAEGLVKVTKVERWNGASWETLATNPAGLTGYFYYSPSGTDTAHFTVSPSGRAQFQLTVKLDETADNDYQGKTFTAGIQAEARQTVSGATWPL